MFYIKEYIRERERKVLHLIIKTACFLFFTKRINLQPNFLNLTKLLQIRGTHIRIEKREGKK